MGGGFDGGAGIEANMARRDIGVERGLGHGAGNGMANVSGFDAGALDSRAGGLDAEIDGRNFAQSPAIVDERRTGAAEQVSIIERKAKAFAHGSGAFAREN